MSRWRVRPWAFALLTAGVLLLAAGQARAADPPEPGTTESLTFGDYTYRVYVPTTYRAGVAVPLVVMAHGCQTSAEDQQIANRFDLIAEREQFIVLYPDVTPTEANFPGPLRQCWQFPVPTHQHRGAGNPAGIAGMTEAVMDRWNVDPQRVYMAGMSAGGFMTSIMAAAYPDLFAAVVINAAGAYADGTCLGVPGGIPAELSAELARVEMGERARVVPRLVMGGDADAGIPPFCADKALEQGLRTNNLVLGSSQTSPISLEPAEVREEPPQTSDGYPSTVSTYRDPAGCLIGERWLIHGMNHFWPGGSSDPESKSFTDPRGPNGSEIAWSFLRRYTKSGTAEPCVESPPWCPERWIGMAVPPGAKGLRASIDGERAALRRPRKPRVRLRLPAGRGERTRVTIRGAKSNGRAFKRVRTFAGC